MRTGWLWLALVWVAGCEEAPSDGGANGPADFQAVSVTLVAPERLAVGEVGQAVGGAMNAAGEVVPAEITFQVADSAVLSVDADGRLLGLSVGRTHLTARSGALVSAPVEVAVVPAVEPPAPGDCVPWQGPVADLITTRCAGCHSGGSPLGGLDLSAGPAALIDVPSTQVPAHVLVLPGDPDASYLIEKLGPGPAVGATMPVGGTLAAGEIETVRAWIAGGAQVQCAAPAEVVSVELVAPEQLAVGETGRAVARPLDVDGALVAAAVTFEVSDSTVLSVEANGTLVGLRVGRATLQARVGDVASPPVAIVVTAGEPPPDCTPWQGPVADLITARCAGCHGGGAPQAGLDLSAGPAALIDVPSTQVPAQVLVSPGDPDASYLITKLGAAPPVGVTMPWGGRLTAAEIDRLRAWIADGALAVCKGEPPVEPVVEAVALAGAGRLEVGEVARVTAEAVDAEGAPAPVSVAFAVADPRVLYVDAEGGILGISPGRTTLVARAAGVESAPLTVEVVAGRPAGARFLSDVLPLLEARCGTAGCHVDEVEPGDLRFDRDPDRVWEELLDDAEQTAGRRVAPGRPEGSYLIEKIADSSPSYGARMPLGQPPLAAADAAVVVRWIVAGATY